MREGGRWGWVLESSGVLGENLRELGLVVDREVETLGARVDLRVLLAGLTDGGGVDNGSKVDEVGLEGGEEELGVLTAGAGEERVLHEGGGLLVELVLEAEEALLAVDIGPGAAEATTEGEEEGI
jgi:hypothetical protein